MTWRNAPITIWLFIALMVATLIVAALPGDPTMDGAAVPLFFTFLWAFLLLRGSNVGWWLVTGLYVLALLVLVGLTVWPWDGGLTATIVLVALSLAALLAPQTRAWVEVGGLRRSGA